MSLRPFPHPWLWRGLFAVAIVAVIVLSLVSNDALRQVDFIGNDKIGHFLAYFVLMAFAVQLRDASADWSRAAFGLLLMSIVLEFLQQASGLRGPGGFDGFFAARLARPVDMLRKLALDAVIVTGWQAWPLLQIVLAARRLGVDSLPTAFVRQTDGRITRAVGAQALQKAIRELQKTQP